MKILVIGGTGTIGSAIVSLLKEEHEVISIGRNNGDYQLDVTDKSQIEKMFNEFKDIDGVISTSGGAAFEVLEKLSDKDFEYGIDRLMGQINLIRVGINHIKENGFMILTSGAATDNPIPGASAISMVNGALESFVKSLKAENTKDIKINVVSPSTVKETLEIFGADSSYGIPVTDTARVYKDTLLSSESNTIVKVIDNIAV